MTTGCQQEGARWNGPGSPSSACAVTTGMCTSITVAGPNARSAAARAGGPAAGSAASFPSRLRGTGTGRNPPWARAGRSCRSPQAHVTRARGQASVRGSPVTGVDGCRTGWVGVDCDEDGLIAVRVAATLSDLLRDTPEQHVVGIDMPLGLLDTGWRTADREARALLGPRRSSIFAIPPAPVWLAPAYADANQMCRLADRERVQHPGLGAAPQAARSRRLPAALPPPAV